MRKQNNKNAPKQGVSKEVKETSVPSLLANVSKEDGDSIYMVNTHNVDVGTTTTATEIAVKHIGIQELHSDSSSVNALLDGQLQDMIDAYATARGYVTGVTVAKVQQYLRASERILSLITFVYKAQNGAQYQTDTGFNIGATLGSRPNGRCGSSDVATYLGGDDDSGLASLINEGSVSISNSVWNSSYLSLLSRVKLPRATVSYVLTHFGVNYAYDKEGSYLVSFVPNFMFATSTAIGLLNAEKTVIDNLRGADADLVDIMHFLGFTSELATSIDFSRDLRQLTVPIVYDEYMNGAILNAYIPSSQDDATDDDINFFIDTTGVYSVISPVDAADFNANIVFQQLLLRLKNNVYHFQVETFKSNNVNSVSEFDFPYVAKPDGITISSFDGDTMDRQRVIIRAYLFYNGPKLPYTDAVILADVGGGSYSFSSLATIGTSVLEMPAAFAIPTTEFEYYQEAKFADMIMGDVKWRQAIQMLTAKIRPRSITRSE